MVKVRNRLSKLTSNSFDALAGLHQRLADCLEVSNIGIVECDTSRKRSAQVRVVCKRTCLVGIVETTGYIAFSKYLFQPWSNGPVPVDPVLS